MNLALRRKLSRILVVSGLLWTVVMLCASCGPGLSTLISTIMAILTAVGPTLTAVGALVSPEVAAALTKGAAVAANGFQVLLNTVNGFEQQAPEGSSTIQDVEAAEASVATDLAQLEAAAQIDNPTVKNWIGVILGFAQTVTKEIASLIQPAAKALAAGDVNSLKSFDAKCMALAKQIRADHEVKLLNSGLPQAAIDAGKTHVDHKLARHIGPVRV